jgi:hypothetical protein
MPDPIAIKTRLDALTEHHAVFEPDQVLTHHQLNSVADYLDDQGALTRVDGLGVGIVSGLHVAARRDTVLLGRGLGLTTDGDLLRRPADRVFDQWKPYDDAAPRYAPFFGGAGGAMFEMVELVPKGESDVQARPLADLPGFGERVVVLLAECAENDPDLCTGADCDNLGRDALHRQRVLLMHADDVKTMSAALPALRSAADLAAALPELAAQRPALDATLANTALLAARVRETTEINLRALREALALLPRALPGYLEELFGDDPRARWSALLDRHAAAAAQRPAGALVWYSAVKDLIETWNAMREALFADDSVAVPDLRAFQKHLLLGQLSAPRQWRTGLYPSPLVAGTRFALAHAKFLLWKLQVLIASFALPDDQRLAITPSRGEAAPLEERAIPWYYALREDAPVHVGWNFRLASRDAVGQRLARDNLGYRAREWGAVGRALDALPFQVAGCDFFRVEGHLGRPVEAVKREFEALARSRNLPLAVAAVLLHTERRHIKVRPLVRYSDLHRMHLVLRKDVEHDLKRSQGFAATLKGEVDRAQAAAEIPAQVGGAATGALAGEKQRAVDGAVNATLAGVAVKGYTAYRANTAWKGQFALAAEAASGFKSSFGNVLRTDVSTAFDHLALNPRRDWLDWLDILIDKKDEKADQRLLFPRFVQDHPGLDALGGAWRGGTWVLVYDDSGAVVADFALPYRLAEDDDDDDEPEIPVAPRPPVIGGIKLVKPLDLVASDIREQLRPQLLAEFNVQREYAKFFSDSVVKFGEVFGKTGTVRPDLAGNIRDAGLAAQARRVAYEREEVERLRIAAIDPARSEAEKEQLRVQLGSAEAQLGRTLGEGAQYIAANRIDVAAGGDGATALTVFTQGASALNDNTVRTELNTRLTSTISGAQGTAALQAGALGNFQRLVGLGR